MNKIFLFFCLWGLSFQAASLEKEPRQMPANGIDKALLGQILFFDDSLSLNGTQKCASCHNPDAAFIDNRDNSAERMVSQGDDPHLFGNRNAPTMMYSSFAPDFHFDEKINDYVGGQFWDGRAKNLAEQAGGPPINPVEMGMPDKLAVAKRLISNPMYVRLLSQHYGENVWQTVESVYAAMEDALATFQREKRLLQPFDSKYDKFLRGEARLTSQEEKGRTLFFDRDKTGCASCHQLQEKTDAEQETFTNYRYYNIGVPKNARLIAHNKLADDFIDNGLLDNPHVKGDVAQKGKFKVPTLRNVAVTAPYMHNGVFKNLRTVLLFLDHYNNPERKINPETGEPWAVPEYAPTLAKQDLTSKALTDEEIDALEAFLKTLTDERYEPLLRRGDKN